MIELAKKSNDQNCVNSKANCVHYMYKMSGCVEKLNIRTTKIQREIEYIVYVQND